MKSTSKKLVDKENLGEALHVALRKGCDSDATSLLWNLIRLDRSGTWNIYLEHVWLALNIAKAKNGSLQAALEDASKSFTDDAAFRSPNRDKVDGHLVTCFDIAFRMFSKRDWEGYACYLEEA